MVDNNFGDGGGVLEITLDAGPDTDDLTRVPQHIDHEYLQRTIKGITRSFTLFDDIYLNYSLNICNPIAFRLKLFRDRNAEQQNINLTYLDPKPERIVHVAWKWFVSGLAAIAWGFVIIYLGTYTDFTVFQDAMLPVGIMIGTFGVISFLIFYYKSQDKVIYSSAVGRAPIIELFHMPRNKAYNDFIDIFEKKVFKAQSRKGVTTKHKLAGELKHLRKMQENGSLPEADYEIARTRILGHDEYKI